MDKSRTHQPSLVGRLLASGIELYQRVSAFGVRRCRFAPSCSEYLRQAILEQGAWQGVLRGSLRILKCHPWHPGGYDPVSTYGK